MVSIPLTTHPILPYFHLLSLSLGYNPAMSDFKFFHPVEIRYGDLDPQGHVNNAKHLTYFEQARIHYLMHLDLFSRASSFMEVGVIIADIHITFHSPIQYRDPIKVGVRTSRIGGKSLTTDQCVMHAETGEILASGTVVLVAYDYLAAKSMTVPDEWRRKISNYEGL
ncbi:MAG: acyl-CoA thioesterase [Chloroflexi bacterium]|nr:acyl-CoA thioesterase [Chloroflexota bacterium]